MSTSIFRLGLFAAITAWAGVAQATTLEAPVTLAMTISVTGPETERTTSAGTDYTAKLLTFKFTNRDYIQSFVDDGTITSPTGWKLVARWTAGDELNSYRFYLVKNGADPIELDEEESGFDLSYGTLAAGYTERMKNDALVSGSGTIKFGTGLQMDSDGDSFQLGGVGTGTYTIAPLVKGGAPTLAFKSLKIELLGGVSSYDLEGVVEMTFSIGKPTVVPDPVVTSNVFGGSLTLGGATYYGVTTSTSTLNLSGSTVYSGGTLTLGDTSTLGNYYSVTSPLVSTQSPYQFNEVNWLVVAPSQ